VRKSVYPWGLNSSSIVEESIFLPKAALSSKWSSRDIEELERFLCFVLEKGEHQFITPKEFVKKQNR